MIRVAIADDHMMVREGIKVLIDQVEEMQVVAEFSNGRDWLNSLSHQNYDVSLIDIDMPLLNGLEALNEALTVDKSPKVIMLTMHNDVNYFREAFVLGARGFILKDMSVGELSSAIKDVYNGDTYFSDEFLKSVAVSLKNEREQVKKQIGTYYSLSEGERSLLTLVCKGYTNKELAEALFLSVKTIESQKTKLLRKAQVKNNAGLIVWAIKNQIIEI